MRRLVWLAAGAAGGVYVYRKSLEAAQVARTRGMVGNVAALQTTAATVTEKARSVREHLVRPAPPQALEPLAPLRPATASPSTTSARTPRARPNGA